MRKVYFVLTALLLGYQLAWADDVFSLSNAVPMSMKRAYEFAKSGTLSPFTEKKPISGFSISGIIEKYSPDYSVRVIMTDAEGKEYLVLESYEELNADSVIHLNNYCEETANLGQIVPSELKVYLRDARLHITEMWTAAATNTKGTAIEEGRKERRTQQVADIIRRINAYNQTNKRLWLAGETVLSLQDDATRRRVLGFPNETATGGIEYYIDGIFEVGHTQEVNFPQRTNETYPDNFDWRNWQGKEGWVTSVKNQYETGYCTPFAAVGCLEAMVNLYYNSILNLDLSEMEIACCADIFPHADTCSTGFSTPTVLQYIRDYGVCDEVSYPFSQTHTPQCLSNIITPVELVQADYQSCTGDMRGNLIRKGPLVASLSSGIFAGPHGTDSHAMLLVGYGTLHENDSFWRMYDLYNNVYFSYDTLSYPALAPDDPRIGATYWKFKNSWGPSSVHNNAGGYIYVLDTHNYLSDCYAVTTPISTINYNEDDIVIEDLDGDGYYNWGIGPKPSRCPVWVPNDRDDDDTDPTKHYQGYYGTFPPVDTYPSGTNLLTTDETYSNNRQLTQDIDINHGVTLTITGTAYCLENVKIENHGGTLIIDGGVLANADIRLHSPCNIIIRNGGSIYLKDGSSFEIPAGVTADIPEGSILLHPKNL